MMSSVRYGPSKQSTFLGNSCGSSTSKRSSSIGVLHREKEETPMSPSRVGDEGRKSNLNEAAGEISPDERLEELWQSIFIKT